MGDLVAEFVLRGVTGRITIDVRPNLDPAAVGCAIVDPSGDEGAALGFPVCRAQVEYAPEGYLRAMGWIQVVRSTDGADPGVYELDPAPLFREVNTPFAAFGAAPDLFDAPFRPQREPMSWQARAYLCASPDGVMTRTALPVAGFSWGFDITESQGQPVLRDPAPLDLETWEQHIDLLVKTHPGWRFR